jgi:hypothetical protein
MSIVNRTITARETDFAEDRARFDARRAGPRGGSRGPHAR